MFRQLRKFGVMGNLWTKWIELGAPTGIHGLVFILIYVVVPALVVYGIYKLIKKLRKR